MVFYLLIGHWNDNFIISTKNTQKILMVKWDFFKNNFIQLMQMFWQNATIGRIGVDENWFTFILIVVWLCNHIFRVCCLP